MEHRAGLVPAVERAVREEPLLVEQAGRPRQQLPEKRQRKTPTLQEVGTQGKKKAAVKRTKRFSSDEAFLIR